MFVSQTHIESKVLYGDGAALPGVTDRRRRADQRAITAREWMLLKIKEE